MITVDDVISIAREALYTIIITGAPCLLVSLIIGLLVSVFQTVTSIQERTLTFVPKILGIFLAIMILGHWMLDMIVNFMINLWSNMSMYVG